jgi:hypothetical protein
LRHSTDERIALSYNSSALGGKGEAANFGGPFIKGNDASHVLSVERIVKTDFHGVDL